MITARALPITILCVAAGAGCSVSCAGSQAPTDDWAAAPDQFACVTDEDCGVAPWHFEDEPCCNASFTQVQSRSFVTWRDRWQAAECSAVDCDDVRADRQSTLSPQQPLPCYFEPRCSRGRCGPSCGP